MSDSMSYLQLANPGALWLLLLVPLLAWLLWRSAWKRQEAATAFSSGALADRLLISPRRVGEGVRSTLLVASVVLLICAAARPRLGVGLERVRRKGADIIVALDTSDSMLAEDATPSRLEAAKREVLGLVSRLGGDRVGLVTFSSQAFLYCPLTVDYDAASMFLESIDARITSGAGTALAAAIREASRALEAGEDGAKVVVLVSDGEDWGQGAVEAAQAARQQGITIHAIGVGTEEGAPVPQVDDQGEQVGVRRENDEVVVSRLNEPQLKGIAVAGGGKYVHGGTADYGAAAVYQQVAAIETARVGTYMFKTHVERFQWPLGAALLLLAIEFALRMWPLSRGKAGRSAGGLLAAAVLCFWLGSGFSLLETASSLCKAANDFFQQGKFAEALERYARALELQPDSSVLHLNAGDALYRQGDLAGARERFGQAATGADPKLAAAAHFNAGNSYLNEKNLDAAIEEYKNALRCDPTDEAAKRNLELAQRVKQRQPQQNQQQDRPDQQNQDRDQQDKQRPDEQRGDDRQSDEPQQQQPQQPTERQAQAMPMTPEEARALLRQAAYDDAQLRKEIIRMMARPQTTTGKNW